MTRKSEEFAKFINEYTAKYVAIFDENPWILDHTLPVIDKLNDKHIGMIYGFYDSQSLLRVGNTNALHPYAAKKLFYHHYYTIRPDDENGLILVGELLQTLPPEYLTKEDHDIIVKATVLKLSR